MEDTEIKVLNEASNVLHPVRFEILRILMKEKLGIADLAEKTGKKRKRSPTISACWNRGVM